MNRKGNDGQGGTRGQRAESVRRKAEGRAALISECALFAFVVLALHKCQCQRPWPERWAGVRGRGPRECAWGCACGCVCVCVGGWVSLLGDKKTDDDCILLLCYFLCRTPRSTFSMKWGGHTIASPSKIAPIEYGPGPGYGCRQKKHWTRTRGRTRDRKHE